MLYNLHGCGIHYEKVPGKSRGSGDPTLARKTQSHHSNSLKTAGSGPPPMPKSTYVI